jgi:hypothetical protein
MSAFSDEVHERVRSARRSLHQARDEGDEYLVGVRVGELESLLRIAGEHGIELPDAAQDVAAHDTPQVIELPAERRAATA